MRFTKTWLFAIAFIGSCGAEDLLRNPLIERWCGDRPCDWEVDGIVRRVGSWHPNDYAAELVSDDAQLSQVNGTTSATCFAFSLIAKITRGTDVYLELDFLDDGSPEFSQRLPVSDWEKHTFRITPPEWYKGVRFIVRKEGPGKAIVGELSAYNDTGYCTAPRVELRDRPDGALCHSDDECASARCQYDSCGGCTLDSQCADGEVCALTELTGQTRRACVAAGSSKLGARCDVAAQCEDGACEDGLCSECSGNKCDDGRSCEPIGQPMPSLPVPRLCDPGRGVRAEGELCVLDSDCASNTCDGGALHCPSLTCSGSGPCAVSCPELRVSAGTCR